MKTFCQFIQESYKNDINQNNIMSRSNNIDLHVRRFIKEQNQLVATFPITSETIISAIKEYTKESSLNFELLSGKKLSKKSQHEYDALMDLKKLNYRLGESHHVYSGSSIFDPKKVYNNKIFRTSTFISTSLNVMVAIKNDNFHHKDHTEKEDVILHFILPKNYGGCFYIGSHSISPEELEMLIFPNETFQITKTSSIQIKELVRTIHTLSPVERK